MALSTIHLMRHGEVLNPDGILYGRLPGFPLTDHGRTMAERVATHLRDGDHDIRAVVSSPLLRARQTAEPAARTYGLDILTDERLTEAGNVFEGERVNANRMSLAHPRNWARYVNPARPSWGEPYTEIATRMHEAIRGALDLVPTGGEVLVVSHQLPIWIARLAIEGRSFLHDPRRRQCALASLTSLTFDGRKLVSLGYSQPAADLLRAAADMVPGQSHAQLNRGGAA